MANTTVSGHIVCKEGSPAYQLREGDNYCFLTFSVLDRQSTKSYFKTTEDNPGQFWKCEVSGKKYCQYLLEQIRKDRFVTVNGQAVWRKYNDKKFVELKNCSITLDYSEQKKEQSSEDLF